MSPNLSPTSECFPKVTNLHHNKLIFNNIYKFVELAGVFTALGVRDIAELFFWHFWQLGLMCHLLATKRISTYLKTSVFILFPMNIIQCNFAHSNFYALFATSFPLLPRNNSKTSSFASRALFNASIWLLHAGLLQ